MAEGAEVRRRRMSDNYDRIMDAFTQQVLMDMQRETDQLFVGLEASNAHDHQIEEAVEELLDAEE